MDLYAKGQLSFLILNCLQERDFYGLDIISEISDRSNKRINLKKPSVYSNLTRMEKQGFVSAYLKSSDLGPNRKYYSITEKGRNFFKELSDYYKRNNIDVFRDFSENDTQERSSQTSIEFSKENDNEVLATSVEYSPIENMEEDNKLNESQEAEDYFDFSSLDQNENTISEEENSQNIVEKNNNYFSEFISTKIVDDKQQEKVSENLYDIENSLSNENEILEPNQQPINENEENNEEENTEEDAVEEFHEEESTIEDENEQNFDDAKKDDAVFINNENAEEYNQRIYDISKDVNRYKKKKSFAEDQISITVNSPLSVSEERTNQNIQSFRNLIEEEKTKPEADRISQYDFSKQMEYRFNKTSETKEEVKDDAKYITERIEVAQRARKITPPRLKIIENLGTKDTKLPPPKRDTSIDPSHKEILSRLYSKTKDNAAEVVREDAIYDYDDLKDYFNGQNIDFSEYKKTEQHKHNTNKLYLILNIIIFLIASAISAVTYVILKYTSQLNNTLNILYIIFPAVLLLDVAFAFYNYKFYSSWFPKQMLASWKIWTITAFIIGAIIGLNGIWGYGTTAFYYFSTTLVLPILFSILVFPVRYYIKRFLLVKYWR